MNFVIAYPRTIILYLVVLFVSVLFSYIAQNSKTKLTSKIFVILVILLLSFIAGLRDTSVGKDTWAYIRSINSAGDIYSGELYYSYFESGFALLIKILICIFKNPHFVILLISLITNVLIIKTLWYFRDNYSFSFSIFLYYTLYYFESFNILRQYLALAIIFWAIKFLLEKKYIVFLFCILLASSIHGAAIIGIIFLPIHILSEGKMITKHKILLLISIICIYIFYNDILSSIGLTAIIEKYEIYYIQGGAGRNLNFGFFFLIRLAIILFSVYVLKRGGFKDYKFSKFIIIVNLFGTIVTMSGYIYTFAGRLGTYAMIFEIILWSQLVNIKYKLLTPIIKLVFIALSLYLFYKGLMGSTQGHVPYKLFF